MRIFAIAVAFAGLVSAQKVNPVKWEFALEPAKAAPGSSVLGRVTARLEPGWHIYSLTTPKGGPTPSTLKLESTPVAGAPKIFQPKPETKFDKNFQLNTEIFEKEVAFLLDIPIGKDAPPGPVPLNLLTRYQACTETECLPRKVNLTANLTIDSAAAAASIAIPADYSEFTGKPSTGSAAPLPVTQQSGGSGDLGRYLLLAFGFGLAAIFTPCVFPMIPITLSFFLNKEGVTRAGSLRQAITFCLGIIVLFCALGFIIVAAVGPFGIVQIGSNPWVNLFIALVFLFFGLNLLGAFELTLPSSLLTRMDQASQRGGVLGTLLMGLTFALTSFACVGPFMGTLLAGSVQRGGVEPVMGMAAFATGLASPFFFLALFPSFLQRMPRSGGWLARVKVVLGFIVLAWMLKYLSSIDQVMQWNVLTRERFLAIWFVLFLLPGLYLLGFLRMEGVRTDEPLGIGRLLSGAAFVAFSVTLLPGMFGGGLGELDSFVPLAPESVSASSNGTAIAWRKNDLTGAIEQAKSENKQVLAAFTGYACTNCHWMKANMFTRPEIKEMLKEFVLVELYTDGTDAASETNQQLQESSFGTVAIPFYVVYDSEKKAVATHAGLTRNSQQFVSFLKTGA